jgi:imidazolonepropionase-like amidohydrolase
MKKTCAALGLGMFLAAGCDQAPPEQSPAAGNAEVQSLAGQATPAAGLVITNARIVLGTGGVIEGGSVVVMEGRIVSAGQQATDVPGALVIDAQGRTVMPGFIDAHRHIMNGDASQWMSEQAVPRMQEFLDAGFTTVLSCGDPLEQILDLRQKLASGEIRGPTLLAAGRAPLARPRAGAVPGGGGVDPARIDVSRPPDRPTRRAEGVPEEETRATVRRLKEAGVDAIKTNIIVTPNGPEKRTLAIVADESKKLGIPTITHAVTVVDTMAAVEAGTHMLVHTPHIQELTDEQARAIAAAGIPMTSTLGIFVPGFGEDNELMRERTGDDNLPRFRDLDPFPMNTLSSAGQGPVNARRIFDAGVVYGYGTDTRYKPHDALRHELRPLRLVFSARDIVRIMTVNTAALIGRSDDLGTIEPGKIADIVLLDGNPLEDVANLLNVAVVIKNGQVVVDKR